MTDMSPAHLRLLSGRVQSSIESLIQMHASLIQMHSELVRLASAPQSVQSKLTALFNLPISAGGPSRIEPYQAIAPDVHFGFDNTATVSLLVRPKRDFLISPESCINMLTRRYAGTSRWMTLEVMTSWAEVSPAGRFQINFCAKPDRPMRCRADLRLPMNDGTSVDRELAWIGVSPGEPASAASGDIKLPDLSSAAADQAPRVLLFFDRAQSFEIEIDYISV